MKIALDGNASSGKSTIAKDLAKKLNFRYIDTGAMYRCVTLYALENNIIEDGKIKEEQLQKHLNNIIIDFKTDNSGESLTYLNGRCVEEEIRGMQVSNFVSPVSKLKFVREYLVNMQQKIGEEGNVVMDGRDIGTVVFPDADVKFFVTASPEVRARRRYEELLQKGQNADYDEIVKNIKERDSMDSSREESPLRKAEDAYLIDTSNMTRDEQLEYALHIIKNQ